MGNLCFCMIVILVTAFAVMLYLFGILEFLADIMCSASIRSKLRSYEFAKLVNQMRKDRSRTCDILYVCVTESENGKFTQSIDDFMDYLYPLNKEEGIIEAELLDDHPKIALVLNYFHLKEELSMPFSFSFYLQIRAAQIEKHLSIDYKSIKKAIKKQLKDKEEV